MKQIILAIFLLALAVFVMDVKPVHAASNVIYGDPIGTNLDALIKRVSFSREGNNLVTTVQVVGRISGTFTYHIGIMSYSNYDGDFQYKIFLYQASAGQKSYVCKKPAYTCEPVQYTIEGDTWTAWTPLTLLGSKSHFWVWIGIGKPVLTSSGSEIVDWFDVLPSPYQYTYRKLNYEIVLPAKVTFALPNSLADKVTLNIDGISYNFDSTGSLSVMVDSGVDHAMMITSSIQSSNDTRYIQSYPASSTLNVDQDSSITLSFQRQFLLTVKSDVGNVSGGGWYNEGSTAGFSVSPVQLPYAGFLGSLSLQHQFTGWSGDVVSNVASSSISMDGPKTVRANWKTVGDPLFLGLVVLVVGSLLVAVFLLYRRKGLAIQRTVSEPTLDQETEGTSSIREIEKLSTKKTTMFCNQCGAQIPRKSKFCKECGTKITS
jgi:hypothetical protein